MSRPALPANPALDGVLLEVDTSLWEINSDELKSHTPLLGGGFFESFLSEGEGHRLVIEKFEVLLEWNHLGAQRRSVERLLKVPGPHDLILWRYEVLTFAGNGDRREFPLPWSSVRDVWTDPLPGALTNERVDPVVNIGLAGAALTYEPKTPVDYAAGDPAAGIVWFSVGAKTFKLAVADTPASGTIVFVDIVPVLRVFSSGRKETKFSGPIREPRKLRLVEA